MFGCYSIPQRAGNLWVPKQETGSGANPSQGKIAHTVTHRFTYTTDNLDMPIRLQHMYSAWGVQVRLDWGNWCIWRKLEGVRIRTTNSGGARKTC